MGKDQRSVSNSQRTGRWVSARPALWLVVFVLSPLLLLFLLTYGISVLLLHLALWLIWGPLGRRVLFVYSNSPVWQEYIEQNVLPRLPETAVVLNWSERRNWNRWTLSYLAFCFFGGSREFNPLAVVIQPLRRAKCFRFWKAFRDFKHGNLQALAKVESEFFEHVKRIAPRRAI
jgi:hypothetical protein